MAEGQGWHGDHKGHVEAALKGQAEQVNNTPMTHKNMIKIYENGKVKEEIDENKVDWLPDASYGGAWIGSERLLGWATTSENIRVPIATDGNETYGSYDNPSGFQEKTEVEEYILMNPDSEIYTQAGMERAIKALSEKYNVSFDSEPLKTRDTGFGAEMAYLIGGNKEDVEFVLSELQEWASLYSEPEDYLEIFFSANPHELENEVKGDGISAYGQKELATRYNIFPENNEDAELIAKVAKKLYEEK